jgi:hypothetical protein
MFMPSAGVSAAAAASVAAAVVEALFFRGGMLGELCNGLIDLPDWDFDQWSVLPGMQVAGSC